MSWPIGRSVRKGHHLSAGALPPPLKPARRPNLIRRNHIFFYLATSTSPTYTRPTRAKKKYMYKTRRRTKLKTSFLFLCYSFRIKKYKNRFFFFFLFLISRLSSAGWRLSYNSPASPLHGEMGAGPLFVAIVVSFWHYYPPQLFYSSDRNKKERKKKTPANSRRFNFLSQLATIPEFLLWYLICCL
jgi:hypothetical protein